MSGIRLSVLMPNYNHGHFLENRIHSILSQLSSMDEYIIVDDGSTDHSISIIEKFTAQDSRLKVIKNTQNLGAFKSINLAVQASQGEYITALSADDLILPEFINKTMQQLLDHPDIGICSSDFAIHYDGIIKKPADHLLQGINAPTVFSFQVASSIFKTTHFWIPGHTAIMKKAFFMAHGGFHETFGPYTDWFINHAIALTSGFAYIPETLALFRVEQESYSNKIIRNKQQKKIYQMAFFKSLNTENLNYLKTPFNDSCLLHSFIRSNLLSLFLRPQYWDFFFPYIQRKISLRYTKYIGPLFEKILKIVREI